MTIPGVPTEVLVAPDSFKGTFTAAEVAEAIASGLEAAGQPAGRCPLADGGEGTLAVLREPLGLQRLEARVQDPLGREIDAVYGVADDGVAVVEMASASGLGLVAEDDRDPVAASTFGTGQLIAAAVEAGARAVLVALGGSATTDGGVGAVRAIGQSGGLAGAKLTLLCDVQTPYEDAAAVFAPQKGADSGQVRVLQARLESCAAKLRRDPRGVAMTGAAGGLAGGLWSEFDAKLAAGAAFVLDAVGFDPRMRAARAVITGEGRLDRQSLVGKLVGEVATRARQAGVPCHAIVGSNELEPFDARILDLQSVVQASTRAELVAAGSQLAAALQGRG
jgi:glycerate kinase